VIEACEWQEHFLEIDADYSMITNVELDHSDYFPDLETYQNAFNKFFDQTRFEVFVNDQEASIDFIRARKSNKNCVLPMQNYNLKVL
jgi:UDP-N-acetylmuramate--alanine ligase